MAQWDQQRLCSSRTQVPPPAQWIKDLALPPLWHGLQLWLGADPWPGNSMCHGVAKKEGKFKRRTLSREKHHIDLYHVRMCTHTHTHTHTQIHTHTLTLRNIEAVQILTLA